MSFQSHKKPPAHPDHLFNQTLDFNDLNNVQHRYTPIGILLIFFSRFSDSIAVIKRESQGYVQFLQDDYSHSVQLSSSRVSDLIDTSSSILIFHHQVCKTDFYKPIIRLIIALRVPITDENLYSCFTNETPASSELPVRSDIS